MKFDPSNQTSNPSYPSPVGAVECVREGEIAPEPRGPRTRIFGSIGNVSTAERTPSVAPFLKALFKIYNISKTVLCAS